jgi:hypothetical protein
VLYLLAPVPPALRRAPVFARLVREMSRSRITPEIRSGLDALVAHGADPGFRSPRLDGEPLEEPWEGESDQRNHAFRNGDPVPHWLLAWYSPFNQLDVHQRQFIARGLEIAKRPAETIFIERGTKVDLSLYLVDGVLELETLDGHVITVTGGTKRAQLPISQLSPHAYTVRAKTPVTVIPVSQSMLRKVTRIATTYAHRSEIEVTEQQWLPATLAPGALSEPDDDQDE